MKTPATLRMLADLLDKLDGLPEPGVTTYGKSGGVGLHWHLYIDAANDQRAAAASIVAAVGGSWSKGTQGEHDETFVLKQHRDGVEYVIFAAREQVCTRRIIGTETVTLPAVEAQPEREVEREVVEWDCGSILAGASA